MPIPSGKEPESGPTPSSKLYKPMRLAVSASLLFFLLAGLVAAGPEIGIYADRLLDMERTTCPYCGRIIRPGPIHQDAEAVLIDELRQALADSGVAYSLGRSDIRGLEIFVYRYQERQGGNFAVQKPASIGFHLHLVDHTKIVKIFEFDETQQPLSDNILKFGTFLRRGGKWVTVRRLAEEGIEKGIAYFQEDLK